MTLLEIFYHETHYIYSITGFNAVSLFFSSGQQLQHLMQFVSESVLHSVRFCDIISNYCFPPQHTTTTGCTVCRVLYSLYILKLIGSTETHRLYSVYSFVQFVHFETDWSQRDPQVVQCVQFVHFGGTHRLYSVYSFVQFGHFETDWS